MTKWNFVLALSLSAISLTSAAKELDMDVRGVKLSGVDYTQAQAAFPELKFYDAVVQYPYLTTIRSNDETETNPPLPKVQLFVRPDRTVYGIEYKQYFKIDQLDSVIKMLCAKYNIEKKACIKKPKYALTARTNDIVGITVPSQSNRENWTEQTLNLNISDRSNKHGYGIFTIDIIDSYNFETRWEAELRRKKQEEIERNKPKAHKIDINI